YLVSTLIFDSTGRRSSPRPPSFSQARRCASSKIAPGDFVEPDGLVRTPAQPEFKKGPEAPFQFWRRGWDSNPRTPVEMLLEFQSSAFDRSATSPINHLRQHGANVSRVEVRRQRGRRMISQAADGRTRGPLKPEESWRAASPCMAGAHRDRAVCRYAAAVPDHSAWVSAGRWWCRAHRARRESSAAARSGLSDRGVGCDRPWRSRP